MIALEDDATLRKHLRRLLAARGYDVEVAGSVAAFRAGAAAVLMSAHGTGEVRAEAERLGVRAMLAKPLDVPALLAALAA